MLVKICCFNFFAKSWKGRNNALENWGKIRQKIDFLSLHQSAGWGYYSQTNMFSYWNTCFWWKKVWNPLNYEKLLSQKCGDTGVHWSHLRNEVFPLFIVPRASFLCEYIFFFSFSAFLFNNERLSYTLQRQQILTIQWQSKVWLHLSKIFVSKYTTSLERGYFQVLKENFSLIDWSRLPTKVFHSSKSYIGSSILTLALTLSGCPIHFCYGGGGGGRGGSQQIRSTKLADH